MSGGLRHRRSHSTPEYSKNRLRQNGFMRIEGNALHALRSLTSVQVLPRNKMKDKTLHQIKPLSWLEK